MRENRNLGYFVETISWSRGINHMHGANYETFRGSWFASLQRKYYPSLASLASSRSIDRVYARTYVYIAHARAARTPDAQGQRLSVRVRPGIYIAQVRTCGRAVDVPDRGYPDISGYKSSQPAYAAPMQAENADSAGLNRFQIWPATFARSAAHAQ